MLSASIMAQTINPTGNLNTARWKHESVLLNNGKVLVFGGNDGAISPTAYNSAELYNPSGGAWINTGNMIEQRYEMASALLPNGNVIAIGGQFGNFYGSMTSEIYDVNNGTWYKADSMGRVRYGHRAVKLNSGKILIAGGLPATNTAEIYDPAANSWTYAATMNIERHEGITLTLLNNGKVLAAGGNSSQALNTAEIYDPTTNTWTNVPGNMSGKRYWHSAVLLNNGKVLLSGSSDLSNGDDKTAELYDPASNSFAPTGSLQLSHLNNSTVKLNNGDVLIYGWGDNSNPSNTKCIEIYSQASGTWSVSQMYNVMGTIGYTVNKLNNNKILIAGGLSYASTATNTCKLINDNTVSIIENYNLSSNIFHIYPNPATDNLYIETDINSNSKYLFTLFDINGKKVLSTDLLEMENIININNIDEGLYFYTIENHKTVVKTGEIIKLSEY